MSTVDRPDSAALLPLVAGQRLDQPTFHERYEAMPPETRAELVEGIVYIPEAVRADEGAARLMTAGWLFRYAAHVPGLRGGVNSTTILGQASEVQPTCMLYIPERLGGRTRIVDRYVTGPPELVVEVGRSNRTFNLNEKKRDYQRAGVPEYVVIGLAPDQIVWFVLRNGQYGELAAAADGLFLSEEFPGLWLDPDALFDDDAARVLAAVDRGLATAEHREFVARLRARQAPK